MVLWPVATQPSWRISLSARETVSRVVPVQPASSSCVSSISSGPVSSSRPMIRGELVQPAGDAPDAVLRRKVDETSRGLGQPADQAADHHRGHVRMVVQVLLELRARDDPELDIVVGGNRRGGPARVGEGGHLAYELAGSPERQGYFPLVSAARDHLHATGEHQHDVVPC